MDERDLRRRAEEIYRRESPNPYPSNIKDMTSLLEELSIHQIELEQQNIQLRESQQELEKSNSRYRDLFNSAPVAYLVTDEKGVIIDINHTAGRMFGLDYSGFINRNITDLIHPEDQDSFYLLDKSSSEIQSLSLRMRNSGDSFFYGHLSFFREEGGTRRFAVSDISPLKQAEEALIANQRMAAVIDFAGNASHDLSNSLQGIMNYIELAAMKVRKGLLKDFENGYFDSMQTLASEMTDRIRELQKLSRSFNGESEKTEIDLSELLESISESLDKMSFKNIQTEFRIEKGLLVSGHKGDLKRVVQQLVENAKQSISRKGILSVSAHRDGNWATVVIKDTGEGMNRETARRIFEPFFTTKGYRTGLGFGLTGVYSIIEEHKGQIKVKYSEPGKGTVIEFRLPCLSP
ncbi:MAG: PAS domain S-box protein [Spirochaetales bacterium]|nr:PAS domain S-box protein [Spirochaetales bacterium]